MGTHRGKLSEFSRRVARRARRLRPSRRVKRGAAALLAAQEDGGVAAWRWCCEDTEPEPRWVPCAPRVRGGTATGRGAVRRRVRNRKRLRVRRRAPRRARRRGRRRVRLARSDFRAFRLGFPRRDSWHAENADARRDRRRLPGRCPRGQSRLRRAPARGNGGEKRARGRGGLSPRAVPRSRPVLMAVSGGALLRAATSSGSSRAERGVQTKIPSSRGGPPASPVRRARPVASTSPSPRASPTPRRRQRGRPPRRRARGRLEISGNFQTFRASRAVRIVCGLATCLHSPSHELLAVTERGNVLCLSPGLRGFDAEASVSQASENEKQKTHSTRPSGAFAARISSRAPISRRWNRRRVLASPRRTEVRDDRPSLDHRAWTVSVPRPQIVGGQHHLDRKNGDTRNARRARRRLSRRTI